jgi:hypothetical protein
MKRLKPFRHFFGMMRALTETLAFKADTFYFSCFCWRYIWVMPSMIIGWYLADITSPDIDRE